MVVNLGLFYKYVPKIWEHILGAENRFLISYGGDSKTFEDMWDKGSVKMDGACFCNGMWFWEICKIII